MSYIRCLSNPEGLYVYHCTDGNVIVTWSDVKWPLAYKTRKKFPVSMIAIPARVFKTVCKRWDKYDGPTEHKGFRVEEQYVNRTTGKIVARKIRFSWRRSAGDYMIKLSYRKKFVFLWSVTWEYVVHNVLEYG